MNDGPSPTRRHHPWTMVLIVALSLVLAIAFFYMTEHRRDFEADRVTDAASKIDGAADKLGDAVREMANRFDHD